MLRFLFFGDRHNSEKIPSSRIGNFKEDCDAKDDEIIHLAKKYNVDALLHPGDFWTDSDKKLENHFVSSVARKWITAGIPIIGIAGNHDLIGNNINSLPNTTTGLLNDLGIFKTLSDGEILPFKDGSITVGISGTNYHKNMDKKENLGDYVVSNKPYDYHIHIVHGMLTTKSYGKLFKHTLIDEISHTNADITLCGHDHVGFGIVNYKDKFFINPGAVVRMTCDEKELNRTVSVVLITIDNNGIQCELIPLQSAKPGSEVLSRQHIESAEASEKFKEFIRDGVEKLKLGTGLTINDVLEDIYQRDSVDETIRNDITTRVANKTKVFHDKKQIAPNNVKISSIELHNFQSYENTKIDLSPGFNVIVGESRQGKSTILRAIRWVATNKPNSKNLRRKGSTETFVELTLENGTIIKRFVTDKDNGYKVYYPDGTSSAGNTRMVADVQKLMGWTDMAIGENETLPLNYQKQTSSGYLIGDLYTGTDRARILGAINNTDGADATIKELDRENSRINDAIKYENVEIATLAGEIESVSEHKQHLVLYKTLVEKAILISKIKEYFHLLENYENAKLHLHNIENGFNEVAIVESFNKINNIMATINTIQAKLKIVATEESRIVKIDSMLEKLSVNLDENLKLLKDNVSKYILMSGYAHKYHSYNIEFEKSEEMLNKIGTSHTANTSSIKDLIAKYNAVINCMTTFNKASRAIVAADNFINESYCVESFAKKKTSLQTMIDRYSNISKTMTNYRLYENQYQLRTIDNNEADKRYDDAVKQKLDILKEHHICPTCYSEISEAIIDQIIEKSK